MDNPTNGSGPAAGPQQQVPPVDPDVFDLDGLEREGGPIKPFQFTHRGRTYTLMDPQDIDWQDLMSGFRNPALFIRFALPTEDHRSFFGTPMPSWKMNALMERYNKHYGIDVGNLSALPR